MVLSLQRTKTENFSFHHFAAANQPHASPLEVSFNAMRHINLRLSDII